MITTLITALANMLTQAGKIAAPILDEKRAQQEAQNEKARILEWMEVADFRSPAELDDYFDKLLPLAGHTIVTVPGVAYPTVTIRVDRLNALVLECCESIKNAALLASMTEAVKQAAKQ